MRRILAPLAVLSLVATPALAATHHAKAKAKVEKTTKTTTVKTAKPKK